MIVPLGALRARCEIRARTAGRTRQAAHTEGEPEPAAGAGADSDNDTYARTLSFKARGGGVGSLRGQIAVTAQRTRTAR